MAVYSGLLKLQERVCRMLINVGWNYEIENAHPEQMRKITWGSACLFVYWSLKLCMRAFMHACMFLWWRRCMLLCSIMQSIVASIKANDVVSPLRLLLNERAKQRDCGRTRFHSIYRDILFLSFVALGRDCIDHGLYVFTHHFRKLCSERICQNFILLCVMINYNTA